MNGTQTKYRTADLKKGDVVFLFRGGRSTVLEAAQAVSIEGEKVIVKILGGDHKGVHRMAFDNTIDWEKGVKHND